MGNSQSNGRNFERSGSTNRKTKQMSNSKEKRSEVSELQHKRSSEQQNQIRQYADGESTQQQAQHNHAGSTGRVSEDNKGEECLQNLSKSLNHHCNIVDGLVATLDAQRGMIGLLVTSEKAVDTADDTTSDSTSKPKSKGAAVDTLLKIQQSCESISKPLKDSFKKLHADIDKSLDTLGKSRIVIDIQQQRKRHEKVQKEVQTSNAEERKLEDDVRQLKHDASRHKSEIEKLHMRNNQLMEELERYRPRKAPATLQLFYLHEGNTIKDIEKELKSMLVNKLGNVNFLSCKQPSDINPDKLVIVLYIVASRVGADAANAIKDIKNPGKTILLLIHYKEVHSLSSERSSDVLSDPKFKNLRGILDLAFMTESGFFHCEMNESSIDALCALCRQRSSGDRL